MTKEPSIYVQLRDQIADKFNQDELRAIVFDLGLDWDELAGSRKTILIQDLIIQLARNGRLVELVELLKRKRPNADWPDTIPVPDQQKQDIRTAFPATPLYKQTWVWAIIIVVLAIVGIGLAATLPQSIASAIPTNTAVPLPTSTPLPFEPAADDQTLIVIATFYRAEGLLQNAEVHNEIRRAIQANIDELDLGNEVQVKVEPTILRTENRDEVEALGNQYNATLIIWGEETSTRIEVSFLNLKEPDFDAAETTISETESTQIASIANPEAYSTIVLEDLPGQISFLSFFALGQTAYSQENNEEAIVLLETAVTSLHNLNQLDNSALQIDSAYFRLGWLYQIANKLSSAIANYDQAIAINPEYAIAEKVVNLVHKVNHGCN